MDVVKMARTARIAREVKSFQAKPAWGIICRPEKEDSYDSLDVTLQGPYGSPYERSFFKVIVNIPERYPFEPPLLKFVTPVYHPNIDKGGRICMDILKMPPNGGWVPTITLETLLVALQTLLANPNPDDPLMLDIANEFKNNKEQFLANARKHADQHAMKINEVYNTKKRMDLEHKDCTKRGKFEGQGSKVDVETITKARQNYVAFMKGDSPKSFLALPTKNGKGLSLKSSQTKQTKSQQCDNGMQSSKNEMQSPGNAETSLVESKKTEK